MTYRQLNEAADVALRGIPVHYSVITHEAKW